MEREIGRELRSVQRMIHHKMEQFRLETGNTLTFVQMQTLHYLLDHQNEDVFQKDIEKVLNIRRSTATEILKVMERDGYITRCSVESDARLKKLLVTQKSICLDQKMHDEIEQMESLLHKNISSEDIETFFRVVEQMKKNLKEG